MALKRYFRSKVEDSHTLSVSPSPRVRVAILSDWSKRVCSSRLIGVEVKFLETAMATSVESTAPARNRIDRVRRFAFIPSNLTLKSGNWPWAKSRPSARRFLHERTDPCLFGSGQLLQREGGRPHGALV